MSFTYVPQLSQGDINELCRSRSGSSSQRRCSNIEISPKTNKVDLLRAALDVAANRRIISNPVLSSQNRPTNHYKVHATTDLVI